VRREDRRSDEELLAATATDADAFAVFYRRHLRSVLAYLIRRTGRPDLAADLAAETFAAALQSLAGLAPSSCRPLNARPDPKRACDVGWGGGSAEEIEGGDAFARRARTERRLLSGRTQVYGQCSDQVDRITVRTPRDIRTLVPSAIGHAFLAVYDGDFPAGRLIITAHLKSGKTWTTSSELGF
jgi:hypothetical protein